MIHPIPRLYHGNSDTDRWHDTYIRALVAGYAQADCIRFADEEVEAIRARLGGGDTCPVLARIYAPKPEGDAT